MSNEKMLTVSEWDNARYVSKLNAEEQVRLARQGMMPLPPKGGYEEWLESQPLYINGDIGEKSWQAALAWAESSGRYIRVPEEWPDNINGVNITGIVWFYTGLNADVKHTGWTFIPRPTPPKPKWEPKVGEWVWNNEEELAGVIIKVSKDHVWMRGGHIWDISTIAPFDQSKIGEVGE